MPGTSKKISELESASSLTNGDLLEVAVVNALSETGYSSKKTTIEDLADKVATLNPQAQADWTEADNSDPSYIQNKPTLATVATSGSYNDLSDQPTIPAAQVNSDWNSSSGVSEILNKPTLGTAASKNTGVANGVAELDANGLVPTSQLPAYVDDVLEYASQSAFPATGETGKIYVALDTNLTYRWGGTEYVEISPSLALGETSSTAYAGNKGKANADAISAIQTTLSGLATVATTGDYDDLIDKPTIPTVNNATVTFTQGGTTKGSITLNQATDATIALDAGGSGSGGHTILDDEGTSLTQRNDLQFKGAYSVDNSTDQITEVNVVREMTKAEFDLLTDDEKVGIINVTDEGGGGLSGDYIHELLWDYVNDNSGTIPFGTYSVTLAESIDKYDCISMCFKSLYSDEGNWGNVIPFLIDVNALKTNPMHANYFNYTSFGERSSAFYLSGKTLQKIIDGTNNTNGLVAVYGIKYGGNNIKYSTDEHVVGTWIDGSTLYERTLILRENGVDKYTFTGSMSEGGNYAVGLTGIDKIWLEGLYSKRGRSDNINYTDIANTSAEVVTVFKHSDGSFYFKDIFNPVDIILTIRYTKSTT